MHLSAHTIAIETQLAGALVFHYESEIRTNRKLKLIIRVEEHARPRNPHSIHER